MTKPATPTILSIALEAVELGEKGTQGEWRANLHHTAVNAGRNHGFVMADSIVPLAAVVLGVEGCSEEEGRANIRRIAHAGTHYDALARALLASHGERDAVLEEAAKVCDNLEGGERAFSEEAVCLRVAAKRIRSLKTGEG